MAQIKRILVPVDFSACSRAALGYAAFLARSFGAVLHVLHVVENPGEAPPDERVRALLAELPELGGVAVERHVEPGVSHERILAAARAHPFDLIVMGTHGRTGLAHLMMGSVAERVMRQAPCPVLVTTGS